MEIRLYKPSDYFEISTWWLNQKWPSIPMDHLPENGFIVEGVAAGFLYKTDSKFALLEFIIANPNVSKEVRSEALDLIIDNLLKLAKDLEFRSVFSSITHPKLIDRYKKHGFIITDENMTNVVKGV